MPSNLIEALSAWAAEQPYLTGLFTGGIYQSEMPPTEESAPPYLTFVQGDSRALNVIGTAQPVAEWLTVVLEVRHSTAAAARQHAQKARRYLLDAPLSLSWDDGRESARYRIDGEGGELEEGLGPGGTDVWVHRLPIVFCTTGA